MATETLTPALPKVFDEKKKYRVRLSRNWRQPTQGGKVPASGVLYQRGEGKFQWTVKDDILTLTGAELNGYCLRPKNQRFAHDALVYELDTNLIAEEISSKES